MYLGQRSDTGQSHTTCAGGMVSGHPDEVWSKHDRARVKRGLSRKNVTV